MVVRNAYPTGGKLITTTIGEDLLLRNCSPDECRTLTAILQTAGLYESGVDSEEALRAKLAHDPESIIVLAVGGYIRGMVVTIFDPWASSLWHLTVDPIWQGRGYGRLLAEEAEKRLKSRGARIVIGYVREDNVGSRALFKKRGWGEFPMPIIPIEKKL
ncbi:MAG: hypothetical protein A3H76_00520 [Candidatus Lloydbacteria bacterium RIFCSPLOWO2_02_FULL_54_12]|nr:MAG: hypothetical protein A3H76_00520 [Candidatus Lloydbacteria bacterium RIFCSPLOWO2_02_FULL_54_12]OGZ15225.1 MAG: hypothetical protein A2948_05430 [Candidatus Lloydbacteria bacterium RIFCSPLOWO2_01_FULL_54_18]